MRTLEALGERRLALRYVENVWSLPMNQAQRSELLQMRERLRKQLGAQGHAWGRGGLAYLPMPPYAAAWGEAMEVRASIDRVVRESQQGAVVGQPSPLGGSGFPQSSGQT